MSTMVQNLITLIELDMETSAEEKQYLPLESLFEYKPPFVTLVISNTLIHQERGEEKAAEMEVRLKELGIETRKHCGDLYQEYVNHQHVVLVATLSGWYIYKARGTIGASGNLVHYHEPDKGLSYEQCLKINVNKQTEVFTQVPMSEAEKETLVKKINDQVEELKSMVANSVHLKEVLDNVEGRSILIQRINDDRYSTKITGRVLDLMRNIFDRKEGHKVTVIQLDEQQKSPVSDYLANCIVLTVYPECVIVDKARGTTCEFEGKSVILQPHIVMTASQYKLLTGKDIHEEL